MTVRPRRDATELVETMERVLGRSHYIAVPFFAILSVVGIAAIIAFGIVPTALGWH